MNKSRIVIVLLGGPGAGKGTQAQSLMRYLGIPQISTGDLLRAEIVRQSEIGRKVEKQTAEGKLVSDELVNKVLANRVRQQDCKCGWILDGYPRTLRQAIVLQSLLHARDKFVVIEIDVEPDLLIERLTSRRTCSGCGTVFGTLSLRPRKEGSCDRCGALLSRRTDDCEEVIRKRFQTYCEQILLLRSYFTRLGVYRNVCGMRPAEEVLQDNLAVLDLEGVEVEPRTRIA